MLEIAGGIILAVLFFALLPVLLELAVWALRALAVLIMVLAAIIAAVWLYDNVGGAMTGLGQMSGGDVFFYVGLIAFAALSLWLQSFEDDREIIPAIRRFAHALWPWGKQ